LHLPQITASAVQLLGLQGSGALTGQSLQDALSIAANAVTNAFLAGKGVDSIYASELLMVTARGLGLQAPSSAAAGTSTGRRLLAVPDNYVLSVATNTSADHTEGVLADLATLLAPNAGPGIGWVSASGDGLSVSVVRKQGPAFNGYIVPVGPATTNTTQATPVQQADLDNTANALVSISFGLQPSGEDTDVEVWLHMAANPAWLITTAPAPQESDITAFKEAAWNSSLAPVAPPLLNITLLTPAVNVTFPYHSGSDVPCVAATGGETTTCQLTTTLPVANQAYLDHATANNRLLLCLRIVDGALVAPVSYADGWRFDNSTTGALRCVTLKQGAYVIAAVDPVDTTPPPVPSPSPAPEVNNPNTSTGGSTTTVDSNTTVNSTTTVDSNTTVNANTTVHSDTTVDTNSTVNNTTVNDNTTVHSNNTVDSNTTVKSNTTSDFNTTSPSPSSSPSPSPSVNETSPSPLPSPQQGAPQTPAAQLHGLLVNLGAVKQCKVCFA
jgi:hypothetical protein